MEKSKENLIKEKEAQIEQLKNEIKELRSEESNTEIERMRKLYVGTCFAPSASTVCKLLDISLVFSDHSFQGTCLNITIPYKYVKIFREGRVPTLEEMDADNLPYIEEQTDEIFVDKEYETEYVRLNNGRIGDDATFENFYNWAMILFDKIRKLDQDDCLKYFNKENLDID